MKILLFIALITIVNIFAQANNELPKKTNLSNVWLKTYNNYKNYNLVNNNINKVELELDKIKNKNNLNKIQELNNKLNIYKSKLALYEKNNNFDELLKKYKYESIDISIYDYLFGISEDELKKKIIKYEALKKEFYKAIIHVQNLYEQQIKLDKNDKKTLTIKEQLEYFKEYTENIEKMHQSLFEWEEELKKKYTEYKNEVFVKHLITLIMIVITYIIYKFSLFIFFYLLKNKENDELEKNYRKIMSLLFVLSILVFIIIRYINDFLYIITFLGIIAAALTIATREIILNIAGAIYIFFSNVIRVGDRVMIQFETKHTIGDISNISLIKMKLNEVTDYNNIKEIKSVGRTIYIPNSYIFTKVFYNYSLKKNGIINDLIEFEFEINSDFENIEQVTKEIFDKFSLPYTISFSLNSYKTGILGIISYQINYKIASQKRGEISISLLKEYSKNHLIKLKSSIKSNKKDEDE